MHPSKHPYGNIVNSLKCTDNNFLQLWNADDGLVAFTGLNSGQSTKLKLVQLWKAQVYMVVQLGILIASNAEQPWKA